MDQTSVANFNTTQIIFYRILMINFLIMIPLVVLFIELIVIFVWKERSYLITRFTKFFKKHHSLIHNCLFAINCIYFLVIVVVGVYLSVLLFGDYYERGFLEQFWYLNFSTFVIVVYFGLMFHLLVSVLYFIIVIKKTDCTIGIKCRQKLKVKLYRVMTKHPDHKVNQKTDFLSHIIDKKHIKSEPTIYE